jgi:hypothetical protein
MKILHVLKSEPDQNTKTLIDLLSEGEESMQFNLYEKESDYEKLIDLVFESDQIVSWW